MVVVGPGLLSLWILMTGAWLCLPPPSLPLSVVSWISELLWVPPGQWVALLQNVAECGPQIHFPVFYTLCKELWIPTCFIKNEILIFCLGFVLFCLFVIVIAAGVCVGYDYSEVAEISLSCQPNPDMIGTL